MKTKGDNFPVADTSHAHERGRGEEGTLFLFTLPLTKHKPISRENKNKMNRKKGFKIFDYVDCCTLDKKYLLGYVNVFLLPLNLDKFSSKQL